MADELLSNSEDFDLSLPENDPAVRRMREALLECLAAGAELRQRAAQLAEDGGYYQDILSLRLNGAANLADVARDYIESVIRSLMST